MFLALILPIALTAAPAQAVQQHGHQETVQSQGTVGPEGTYRASVVGEASRPEDDRTGIELRSDGSFVLTLGDMLESATFYGAWHQEGDQVIFDSIEAGPPITLEHASSRTDGGQRLGQDNGDAVEPTTTVLFKPERPWLAEAMAGWEVRFQFEDGETVIAVVNPATFTATAFRAGKLHGIRVKGSIGRGGGDVTVPIPPDCADAEIFTLAVHRIAIETTGTSETPPPLTIADDGLILDGLLVFEKKTP